MMFRHLHFIKDFHKIGAVFGHGKDDEKTVARLMRRNKRDMKEIKRFIKYGERIKNERRR